MNVRPARLDDADALGRVHVDAWQAAYRGVISDSFLDALDPAVRAEQWRRTLGDPSTNCLVVTDAAGAVRGFSLYGPPNPEPDPGPGTGELYAINLEPSAWGTGLGRLLLMAVSDELHRMAYREAILWVVDGNARARRFYEIAGWSWDGGTKDEDRFGDRVIHELRYRRPLPAGQD